MSRGRVAWGPWRFNQDALSLDAFDYWVDLEDCKNSASVLDWMIQVAEKWWATPEVLGHLLLVLDDLAGGLRAVCDGGQDHEYNIGQNVSERDTPWYECESDSGVISPAVQVMAGQTEVILDLWPSGRPGDCRDGWIRQWFTPARAEQFALGMRDAAGAVRRRQDEPKFHSAADITFSEAHY